MGARRTTVWPYAVAAIVMVVAAVWCSRNAVMLGSFSVAADDPWLARVGSYWSYGSLAFFVASGILVVVAFRKAAPSQSSRR